jgi:hypothetical protein
VLYREIARGAKETAGATPTKETAVAAAAAPRTRRRLSRSDDRTG